MKKCLLYTCFIAFSLTACKKTDQIKSDTQEFDHIKLNYDGRYNLASAVSDNPVDINLDGNANKDLLKEIPDFNKSTIIIRVIKDINPVAKKNFAVSFDISYPEQYALVNGREISSFNPQAEVIFLNQGFATPCEIDTLKKSINLLSENNSNETIRRFTRPNEIKILEDGKIQISIKKEFYTKQGWVMANITSVYKK